MMMPENMVQKVLKVLRKVHGEELAIAEGYSEISMDDSPLFRDTVQAVYDLTKKEDEKLFNLFMNRLIEEMADWGIEVTDACVDMDRLRKEVFGENG